MRHHRTNVRRWMLAAAVLASGVVTESCMVRSKEALVEGSKSYLFNVLLNPENLVTLPYDEAADTLTGG